MIERGEQQGAGAGAEIEDAARSAGAGEMIDRGLDQRLAVGARDEYAGADLQVDRPEGAGAGEIGDRLVARAAVDECGEGGRDGMVVEREQQAVAVDAQRMGEQQLGVEPRGGRESEARGGVAEGVAGGGHTGVAGANVANVEMLAGCLNVRVLGY